MPKTMEAPPEMHDLIGKVEAKVENLFEGIERNPRESRTYLAGKPYMLMSLKSLAIDLREEMSTFLDPNGVSMVIYRFGQAIGRSEAERLLDSLGDLSFREKLLAGPIFAAYAGFVRVRFLPGSNVENSDDFFLFYEHPNNFEAHYLQQTDKEIDEPVCYFNAGYSSGWESTVLGMDLDATEVECEAAGDPNCRFIMYPSSKSTEYLHNLDKYRGEI